MRYTVIVNNVKYNVDVEEIQPNRFRVNVNGKEEIIEMFEESMTKISKARIETEYKVPLKVEKKEIKIAEGKEIKAEMSGTIVKILKREGESIKAGEPVLILEAMKMENEIISPLDGVISKILVKEGDKVQAGDVLAVIL